MLDSISPDGVKYSIQTRKLLIDLLCKKINVYSTMLSQCGPYCFLAKQSEWVSLMKQHNM